jgi:hypothetical protein
MLFSCVSHACLKCNNTVRKRSSPSEVLPRDCNPSLKS